MVTNRITEFEREWRATVMDELREIKRITTVSAADVAVLKAQGMELDQRLTALEEQRGRDQRSQARDVVDDQRSLAERNWGVLLAIGVSVLGFALQHLQLH